MGLSGHRFPLEDLFPRDCLAEMLWGTNTRRSTLLVLPLQLLMTLVHLGSPNSRLSHIHIQRLLGILGEREMGPVQVSLSIKCYWSLITKSCRIHYARWWCKVVMTHSNATWSKGHLGLLGLTATPGAHCLVFVWIKAVWLMTNVTFGWSQLMSSPSWY